MTSGPIPPWDHPYPDRAGRISKDGRLHYCTCGRWGAWGFNCWTAHEAWFCDEHRPVATGEPSGCNLLSPGQMERDRETCSTDGSPLSDQPMLQLEGK